MSSPAPASQSAPPRPFHEIVTPGRRRLIILLVLIPIFIGSLDLTIVSAILPEVLTKLSIPVDTNLGLAAWAVTGYLLAYTVSMMVMGRVSDLVGRRGAFLVCLAIFTFGSLFVATAHLLPTAILNDVARRVFGLRPDLNQLTLLAVIIGRVVQALGAGAIVPVSLALVADLFPPEKRGAPVGLVGAFDTLGWVLGHLYGGLMVNFFSVNGDAIQQFVQGLGLDWPAPDWRTLFWLNVPLGIFAFVLMWFALRGVEHPAGKGRFDVIGALLIAATLIMLVLGLGGNTDVTGATSLDALNQSTGALPYNAALLLVGAVFFVLFLVWELKHPYPMLELHLFRKRNISAATLSNLLVGFCLMLGLVSVPLLINLRAADASAESIALAAQRAGILLSALTVPMAAAAIPGAMLAARIGYRGATATGMLLAALGFALAGFTWTGDTPEGTMALHMVIAGVGLGLTISPIGTAVINEVDEDRRGVASALVLIMRLIGMTVAISALTTFALNRVSYLVGLARLQFPAELAADELQRMSFQAYFDSGVQVIGEMLLIGALVSLITVIPALLMRKTSK